MHVASTHDAKPDERNADILVNINNELFHRDDAKISVFDSGYLVGDGVWEAIRLHEKVLVFASAHLERMWQAAHTIGLRLPFTQTQLVERVTRTLTANNMTDGVHVRIMVTRGNKKTPSQDPRLTIGAPNVVIIPEYKTASEETKAKGIKLFTSSVRRGSPDYLDPKLNCHSKLHEVIALIQAQQAGADEALMLDVNGFVSTCNATNFFIVKNEIVRTSTGQYCMNGITRAKVLEACKRSQIPVKECNFSLFDVYGADEAFVTGTFGGLTPVTDVDGRKIGNGSRAMTTTLQTLYHDLITEDVAKHSPN